MPASRVPGVLSVRCPACRAGVGRPCRNKRGYLAQPGHAEREGLWTATELADAYGITVGEAARLLRESLEGPVEPLRVTGP